MADFSSVVQLSTLNGATGFEIRGLAAGDQLGWAVSRAGDINGDGIADLIVSGIRADPNGVSGSGASYVIFGRNTASQGDFVANFDLATLNGTNGFRIDGEALNDYSGWSATAAGDINGDGVDDLILGGPESRNESDYAGATYVVFGKDTAVEGNFGATFQLSALDGTNGFKLIGSGGERLARSVASAGDVNGDGIGDVILGTTFANGSVGASYVVFGSADGFDATLNVSTLDGANGFRINGETFPDQAGRSVASAGDVNGDGIGDLVIGAADAASNGSRSGSSYVVFGRDTAEDGDFAATLNLSDLDGVNGFQITGAAAGDYSGWSVASGGDVNGDGYDDVVIGAKYADNAGNSSGSTFVVFGGETFGANLNLADLDGDNGFRIDGEAVGHVSGFVVGRAGDVNGDGYGDVLITAAGANSAGATWVLFGKATPFTGTISLSSLDGTNGFQIDGEQANDLTGRALSGAGDLNGDGVDDIALGGAFATRNGSSSGVAYVVFGIQADLTKVGGAADETLDGASATDSLSGMGGKDILNGLAGNDILDGGDGNDLLNGGDGADDLVGGLGGDTLFGGVGIDDLNGGDGADKLYGGTGADLLNGGTGNDRMDGQSDIDTLNGGAGNDHLDGGLGADIMSGGTENDVYIVDDAGDQTIEQSGEGYDIVRTTLDWVLGDNIEALSLEAATNAAGTGNGGSNNLQGNAGDNSLSGLAGVDTINGNDGDDIVIGGQGNDLLRGGIGLDTFRVEHAFSGALETDQIYDFQTAEGDRMDFSDLFAGTIAKVGAFSHTAGEMTLTFASGQTTVRLDIDGNGVAEYQVKINGDVTGDWSGWLL